MLCCSIFLDDMYNDDIDRITIVFMARFKLLY